MVEDVKKGKVARENQYLRDKIAHMYWIVKIKV